jgi:hypothetical protein
MFAHGSKIPFFYRYKIYHKFFEIRQFSGSIVKKQFWLRGPKFESNPMGHIQIWLTWFDFRHGSKKQDL